MRRIMLAALPLLSTCAVAPARTGQSCFWASSVTGFSSAGPGRARINIGTSAWEVALSPGCPDVDWAMRIGIRSRGGERICSGADAELLVPDSSGDQVRSCLIRSIRKLPSAETPPGFTPKP